jgi:tetratricopeptide (TPR) repeat protein
VRTADAFAGEFVTIVGRLLTISRKRAAEIVAQLGGSPEPDLSPRTTMVVVGADNAAGSPGVDPEIERKLRRGTERAGERGATLTIVDEDAFCERAGLITPTALRSQFYSGAAIRNMYPAIREQHLRYLEKWGLLRSIVRTPGETWFRFTDLAVIRQAHDELARGAGVKAVLRALAAAREGQLALDFHPRGEPATRVVRLPQRVTGAAATPATDATTSADFDAAEELFNQASTLDTGDASGRAAAMNAYRRALLLAPQLVPALVNLGNLHYAEDHFAEAQALYLEAALNDPDCFEARFNLGNLLHDLGRFGQAETCYREAVRIDPSFADAHFYLAVTLEKQGRSTEARPHWKRYQELAPDGEWIELAREFTE